MIRYILFICFCISTVITTAQEDRYTEEEIAVSDQFIEAKKYTLIGRYDKAQEILSKLYKEDRSNAAISLELSKVHGYLEDPYNQHKYAQKAAHLKPNDEFILNNFAFICADQEKFDEALVPLQKLVTLNPNSEEYADRLATVHLNLNDAESALTTYENIQNNVGLNENIARRKFEIYEILGDQKNAEKTLRELVNHFPQDIQWKHNLAAYLNKLGKSKKALAVYQSILEIDEDDPTANMAIATSESGKGGNDSNYLRSLGKIVSNESIALDKKVLELIPYIDKLNTNFDGELADALIVLGDKIANIHPSEAKSHALKADIYMAAQRPNDAEKAYAKTIELNDNIFSVWEGWMTALSQIGDFDQLKNTSTEALDLYPNEAMSHFFYGRAHTLTGDTDEAIDLLEEGIFVSGKNMYKKSHILSELGRAYLAKQDINKAKEYIDKALEISNNKNALALELMGDLSFATGKTQEAVDYWKKAQIIGGLLSHDLSSKIEQKKI